MNKTTVFLNNLAPERVELSTRIVEDRHQYAKFIPGGKGIKRLKPGVIG